MTLSQEDRAYDAMVTVGRAHSEMYLFEIGYWIGILGDYLDADFADEQRDAVDGSSWYHRGSFDDAIEEGAASRDENTAEDLYLWAHDWMRGRTWPGAMN